MRCPARVNFRTHPIFIIYINDICNVSSILKCIFFADDTNFLCSGDDLFELCEIICLELEKLSIWFAVNKLSLNVEQNKFYDIC